MVLHCGLTSPCKGDEIDCIHALLGASLQAFGNNSDTEKLRNTILLI